MRPGELGPRNLSSLGPPNTLIRPWAAAVGHSGLHAKELLKPAHCTAFFSLLSVLWLMVFFFQREDYTYASSPAAARQRTLLLNGDFASAAVST